MIIDELFESPHQCPECGGISFSDLILAEKKDACYHKVKASAKVWPSAYASGRLVQCRKKGAANYGNKSEGVAEGQLESNTPDPVVVVQDLKGNILDKINLSVAAQKYKLGQPQNIKNQLAHQNYTKIGNYTIVSPMSGQPQDATTQGVAETELEEVDRRGFLKGLGAAAVAGAAGGVATKADAQEINKWVSYATNLATKSMERIHQDSGYDLRNWLVVNVSNWVTDYCTKTNSYKAKEVIDYCNQQGLDASGLDKQHALVTAFLTNMKNRYQDFLSAYRAGINESFQKFNAAVQSQEKEKNVMGNLGREEFDVLLDALIIYAICKDRQLDNSDLFKAVAASIKRFIDANNAKDYVNNIYPKAKQSVEMLKNNPDIYQKESSQFFKNAGNTIAKLDNISANKKPEFESVQQGMAEAELDEKSVSQAQFRTMAGAAHNPEFARKVGISQDVAKEFNQADKKSNYKKLPARATEGEQQKGADYRDPKEVDYDDAYDSMVARVKKLAGLGPMKTVYDPAKRVYRNVPTAVQPKK